MSYPSDLHDEQWVKIEPFSSAPIRVARVLGNPKRRVVEAVLHRLREGCRWRALPHDFPPWDTMYDHWRRWRKSSVWPQAVAVLGTRWREVALGREATLAMPRDPRQPSGENGGRRRGEQLGRQQEGQGPCSARCRGQPGHAFGRARLCGHWRDTATADGASPLNSCPALWLWV